MYMTDTYIFKVAAFTKQAKHEQNPNFFCVPHIQHVGSGSNPKGSRSYMLNTWSKEQNTVFYSFVACFVNTLTLNT